MEQQQKKNFEEWLKSYLTPLVLSAFGFFFINTINDIKQDLKQVLTNDNTQMVKIQYIESEIKTLQERLKETEKLLHNSKIK